MSRQTFIYNSLMPRESKTAKKARALRIIAALKKAYPEVECTLNFDSAWELLVGGILAAQCTDERVNKVTAELFPRFPNLEDYVEAELESVEEMVRSCGLYRNKAKNIKASAEMLIKDFDGVVPDSQEDLMKLPGVGRKIANLIYSDYYGHPAIVVDTHCGRISRLLGLVKASDPAKIEQELAAILPSEEWTDWGHRLVTHGRVCCRARKRTCLLCAVNRDCAYAQARADELSERLAEGDLEHDFFRR
ncbi:MAG: endonuclease III [Eubacteriales bacterium]|nr:endonuclease III [Eubacteriales bacterium]